MSAADQLLTDRLELLATELRALGSVLVAFSAGADSAFLLAAAVRALGVENVAAATGVSSSLATGELDEAAEFAAALGVRWVRPRTNELAREGYAANASDRCFFCKAELLDVLNPVATELGLAVVVTGTNADDAVADFRPGIRAAAERGARTPLRDAGFTKEQVRQGSQRWGLRTWDKPAAACLSSRVAYGIPITSARLARVDRAEQAARSWLAAAGVRVRDLRVRDLGEGRARIEVDRGCLELLSSQPSSARSSLERAVGLMGFERVELDSQGFRSGSMNEALVGPEGRVVAVGGDYG